MKHLFINLFTIRHGQAASNLTSGILNGITESPLTDLGRRQAERAADWLGSRQPAFDLIYSSDLSRAYDTVLTVATGGRSGVPTSAGSVAVGSGLCTSAAGEFILKEPLLRERDFGRFENAPWADYKKAVSDAGLEDPKDWHKFQDESMESLERVEERAGTFLKKMIQAAAARRESDQHNILVSSHGIFIKQLVIYLHKNSLKTIGLPSPDELAAMWIPNTGLSKIRLEVDPSTMAMVSTEADYLFSAQHLEDLK